MIRGANVDSVVQSLHSDLVLMARRFLKVFTHYLNMMESSYGTWNNLSKINVRLVGSGSQKACFRKEVSQSLHALPEHDGVIVWYLEQALKDRSTSGQKRKPEGMLQEGDFSKSSRTT